MLGRGFWACGRQWGGWILGRRIWRRLRRRCFGSVGRLVWVPAGNEIVSSFGLLLPGSDLRVKSWDGMGWDGEGASRTSFLTNTDLLLLRQLHQLHPKNCAKLMLCFLEHMLKLSTGARRHYCPKKKTLLIIPTLGKKFPSLSLSPISPGAEELN